MKQRLHKPKAYTQSFRLVAAIALAAISILVKVAQAPADQNVKIKGGAEQLAKGLTAATQAEADPRRGFPSALGRALTFGFSIDRFQVTVLTWTDIDRENLRLLGAVLNIPKEFFATYPQFAGCDSTAYARGTCRFDIDFSKGNPQVINSPAPFLHDYKTSDASQGLSNHL